MEWYARRALSCYLRYETRRDLITLDLFAVYIDDVITHLKNSGYGIYVGQIFTGCALYADDIALLSASCYGLQNIVNICKLYGDALDVNFKSLKSQLIAFEGDNPNQCSVTLNGTQISWTIKVRYLGVYFFSNSGFGDISDACRKFYGQFNNIMLVLRKCSREMSVIHLIKPYCLPTMLYGCEVWTLSDSSSHRISVAWNNGFRRVFIERRFASAVLATAIPSVCPSVSLSHDGT